MRTRLMRLAAIIMLISTFLVPAGALAAPLAESGDIYHTVKVGETLEQIADQYGVTVTAILVANDMDGPGDFRTGQRLLIPPPVDVSSVVPPAGEYVVVEGDTLTSIAAEYGVTIAALAAANGLLINEELEEGTALSIPQVQVQVAAPVVSNQVLCTAYHLVQRGDTLTRVAKDYSTTVAALTQANDLSSDVIWVGQKLCIPSPLTMSTLPSGFTAPAAQSVGPAPAYQPPTSTSGGLTPPEYKPPSGATWAQTEVGPFIPPQYQPPAVTEAMEDELGYAPSYPTPQPYIIKTELAWVGSQTADIQDPNGITTMVVLTWDQKDLGVAIRSQSGFVGAGTTGEYFEFSWVPNFAFRGIPAGIYQVWIEGEPSKVAIAEVKDGRRTIVDFKKQPTIPDMISAAGAGGWTADIVEDTCGTVDKGVSSILVVRTGANGQRIRVTAPGGYEATCTTGTKMENGIGACNIGGLSAGTYQITVDGSGTWLELYLDGQCTSTIEFRPG